MDFISFPREPAVPPVVEEPRGEQAGHLGHHEQEPPDPRHLEAGPDPIITGAQRRTSDVLPARAGPITSTTSARRRVVASFGSRFRSLASISHRSVSDIR